MFVLVLFCLLCHWLANLDSLSQSIAINLDSVFVHLSGTCGVTCTCFQLVLVKLFVLFVSVLSDQGNFGFPTFTRPKTRFLTH